MTVALPSVLLETNNVPILILMAGVGWQFFDRIIFGPGLKCPLWPRSLAIPNGHSEWPIRRLSVADRPRIRPSGDL